MPDSMLSELDFAYAAGLIDGEGYIAASCHKTKSRGRSVSPRTKKPYLHCDSRISMSMTAKEPLYWLLEKFGGTVYFKPTNSKKHKNQWTWVSLGNGNKATLLKGIIPFLKVKQKQAILLLEYVQLKRLGSTERRLEIVALCKELNRKGKPVETNTPDPSEKWTVKIESELTGDCKKTEQVTDLYGVNQGQFSGDLLEANRIMCWNTYSD